MSDRVYIHPLTFAPSPQAFAGDAVRLAGGMVYAREFAVLIRRAGKVAERALATAETIDDVLAELPDELGPVAEAQWANLRAAHPPLRLG
jgi:dihydropteroate synthase